MKKLVLVLCGIVLFGLPSKSQDNDKELFKKNCFACHTVGQGKLVVPNLSSAKAKRNEAWLLKFIESSQTMVKSNDPIAVKVFNENNKIVVPN